MKKVVLKLEFADEKIKQKAMSKVSGLPGIESVAMDPKDKKLTVIGDIDPVSLVDKLRKICQTGIVSVGPAKEPEKNKEQPKPDDKNKDYMSEYLKAYQKYYKQQQQHYYNYYTPSKHYAQPAESTYYAASVGVEENPNSCGELQNGRVNPAGEAAVEFPGDAERVGWILDGDDSVASAAAAASEESAGALERD
ncbi:heavy metal-associated isoprenylated plant protein 39-like [Forsythia ovata]|uniref:Heavy metal-associated isoprenylated plant protein 39-like n=1 Tax=Forsythia ovata TaxID=205694 RepID=A0ABD1X5B0_9LAMI